MVRKFFRHLRRGEKGFTLIELMIALAIIGVLAAVAMPNITNMMGTAKKGAQTTEFQNVQVAVISAMADQKVPTISGTAPFTLDNTPTTGDVTVANAGLVTTTTVGAFINGGNTILQGTYSICADGTAIATAYPGLDLGTIPACPVVP